MKYFTILFSLMLMFTLISCNNEGQNTEKESINTEKLKEDSFLHAKAVSYFEIIPEFADNPENEITEAKVKLGKLLYFDNRLSNDGNISCNSCHNLATYGVDNLPTSPGDDGTLGTRNSPTVLNAAFHTSQFWDGRAKDVEEQAGMPVTNPVEMAMPDEHFVVERISEIEMYQTLFAEVYPDEETPITYDNIKKAIAAFERKLVTHSKFDDYLGGDFAALNEDEKAGMETFINSGCIACHRGSVLGGNLIQKFPLFGEYSDYLTGTVDKGKFEETKQEGDEFLFKVPALRNIEKTYPYMHDGSIETLEESIKIMAKAELNKDLTEEEVKNIIAFLKALTGELPEDLKAFPAELEGV